MTKMLTLRFALPPIGIVALLGVVALSWQPDGRLHVHALNVEGGPVFVQTPSGRQILIGGSNSPSALLAALGARMPFWDRDIDVLVVPKGDARSLNGLLAVVDRYRVGQIVSVEIGDSRADREWLDALEAKSVEVIEAGSGVGIEGGVSLSLDESGWVRIETGGTSVGIGAPGRESHADVIIADRIPNELAERINSMQPQIVVTRESPESDFALEGIALIISDTKTVELIFDGARWEVRASP